MTNYQIGSIVNFPVHPWDMGMTRFSAPLMGIGFVDATKSEVVPCIIEPYMFNGINFKLVLQSMIEGFVKETLYRSDFEQYLKKGTAKVRLF